MPELTAVVAVAEHRSFRRAAAALGVSPSALSHAIASLEQRLGVRLFHRTTRSVALSEAGARFVDRVRPALRELADAVETANDFRTTPRGTLRLNAATAAVAHLLEPVILPFLDRYPDMRLDVVAESRLVDIVAGGFDAGIRLAETVPRDMIAVPCSPPLRFRVVGSPAYFAARPPPHSPADLHAHRCIRRRMPSGVLLGWELERAGRPITVDVDGPLTLDDGDLMVEAALRGAGLAWVNEWTVAHLLADGRLVSALDDWSPPFPGLCLYYPAGRHPSAGLRAFVQLVRTSRVAGRKAPAAGEPRPRRSRSGQRRR